MNGPQKKLYAIEDLGIYFERDLLFELNRNIFINKSYKLLVL